MDHLAGALKKGGIKDLFTFFPPNRRSDTVLDAHFRSAGLPQVADWWTRKRNALIKEDIAKAVKDALEREDQSSDVRLYQKAFFFLFSFCFYPFSGLLKRRNRSSLPCVPLLRSVRSLRLSSSRASGMAFWRRWIGAHARIKLKALLCAKSRYAARQPARRIHS